MKLKHLFILLPSSLILLSAAAPAQTTNSWISVGAGATNVPAFYYRVRLVP
jgi:hypothetical protein